MPTVCIKLPSQSGCLNLIARLISHAYSKIVQHELASWFLCLDISRCTLLREKIAESRSWYKTCSRRYNLLAMCLHCQ